MRVIKVVDLSVPVDSTTVVYPGDPAPALTAACTLERDGFNVASVQLGSQSGTHVDAPYHFEADGARIDELDPALFVGPAVVVDATGLPERTSITWPVFEPYADRLGPGVLLLLHTGWSAYYGSPRYFAHPYLDADACTRLLGLGVRTILIDAINLDETPDDTHPGAGYPCHHQIAKVGGVIAENLRDFDRIDFEGPFVSVLPVRLTGADGAWTRAVAMQLTA